MIQSETTPDPIIEEIEQQITPPTETAELTDSDQPNTETEQDSEKAAGVIRNLLKGHFKGTADVRLRIVHAEKLAAIQAEQLKAEATQAMPDLLQAVDTVVDAASLPTPLAPPAEPTEPKEATKLTTTIKSMPIEVPPLDETQPPAQEPPAPTDPIAQLHIDFETTVNQLTDQFATAADPNTADLLIGIRTAFDSFVIQIQQISPEPTPAPPKDSALEKPPLTDIKPTSLQKPMIITEAETVPAPTEPANTEPPAPETPAYQQLIDDLTAVFTTAFEQLTEQLVSVQTLPPLSPPNGKGKAYEKFLNILQPPQTTPEPTTPEAESVNTIA